jgi:DNA-binding transcriptional LysR family regulator
VDNRAGEMEVFVHAAKLKSFSAAGRKLRMSPSAVSKLVTRIEERLGTRLFVRTTRALELTQEGEVYLEQAQLILDQIEETERRISNGSASNPRGRLKVTASVAFGVQYVVPLVADFLAAYPEVELDLSLNDGIVDIVGERADVAIRSGDLRDSSLKARKLLESRRVIVASPRYLASAGTPSSPDDVNRHNCLTFNFRPALEEWPFRGADGGPVFYKIVRGNFEVNNGPTMRRLCLDGLGLGRIGEFHVRDDIKAGTLVTVLEDFNPGEVEFIHAVYPGHEHLAGRIRAFVDFLADRIN